MKPKSCDNDHYMSSVKVGPKGQIVIPKEARDMFHIAPGDTLLLLADRQRGIAIQQYGFFAAMADAVFEGRASEVFPEQTTEESQDFAEAVREAVQDE